MKTISLIAVILFGAYLSAQTQFENAGFEGAWEDVSGTEDEPIQWSSIKTADALAALAPIVLFKSLDAHTGSYSIRMANTVAFGLVANGIVTNGRVHADFDPALGYVFTDASSEDWRTTFTDRPDSLVGWFKYSPMGADRGKIEILLHDNTATGKLPEPGAMDHWVGRVQYDIEGTVSEWTRFSVPFTYLNDNSPNYLLAVITSGDTTAAVAGSQMWMDDLELIYNPNLVLVTPSVSQNNAIGEDGDLLTVTETANAAVVAPITREWKYSTTPGTGYISFPVAETGLTYMPNFAVADIYYVICETDFGTEVIISNEVEIVVIDPDVNSVTISPSGDQTLLTDETGATLNANETPAPADSREWKFGTVAGGPYSSFTPSETSLFYSPNFPAVGTYFVVCESDFAGDFQASNEVIIHVAGTSGLSTADFDFTIYKANDQLVISYSDFESALFTLYGLDGKKVYQEILNASTTYHSAPLSGVYVYQIQQGNQVITGKISL